MVLGFIYKFITKKYAYEEVRSDSVRKKQLEEITLKSVITSIAIIRGGKQ